MMGTDLIPSVAVVILNYNTKNLLERFLPSVLASTYSNIEVVVADNASSDGSVEMVISKFPEIKVVTISENRGYAGGYNEVMKQVDADYSILLNSDVQVNDDWIEPMVELAIRNPKIAAIQPKILDYKSKGHFEYAGASGGFIDWLGYPFCRGRIFDVLEEDKGQYDTEREVFWTSGAALFIKTSVFKSVGGFDEEFFAHMEEIDLCWRLHRNDYELWCQPQSVVYHLGGGTLEEGSPKKFYLNYRNSLILLTKNLPTLSLFPILLIRLLLDGLSAIKFTVDGRPEVILEVIKAHWHFFGSFFKHYKKRRNQTFKSLKEIPGIYQKSIVVQFFLMKQKVFKHLPDSLKIQ